MNKRDLEKLKPGDLVKIKRSWGLNEAVIRVISVGPETIRVKDGRDFYEFVPDALTLFRKAK